MVRRSGRDHTFAAHGRGHPQSDEDDSDAFQDDSDDSDYGTRPVKKRKTPKKTPKKSPKKKTAKSPRGKISPSKTPASKRSIYYESDSEDEDDVDSSTDDVDETDFSEDDDDYGRGRGRPSPSGKRGRPAKGRGRPPQKSPVKKSPLKKPKEEFPPVSEMVIDSIKALKDNPKKGSTLGAIKETIALNWPVNMTQYDKKIKRFILKAIDSEEIIQTRGKGFRGRFTLPNMKVKRKKPKSTLGKKFDEDEPTYTPKPTKRDEDRKQHQEELELKRVERQEEEQRRAIEKAAQPKKPRPVKKEAEYVVEGIVGMKEVNGEKFYKVKWEGYNKPTWEEEANVDHCKNLIKVYFDKEKVKMAEEKEIEQLKAEGQYEVAKIMNVSFAKDNTRYFQIRWKHCKPSEDTWEPEENLDCTDMIERFMATYEKMSDVGSRQLREAPKKVKRLEFETNKRLSKRGRYRQTYEDLDSDYDYDF